MRMFNLQVAAMTGSALFAVAMGILITLFWMIVGWRAMRAHERLAKATEDLVRSGRNPPSS
jgi:hypothetical protein